MSGFYEIIRKLPENSVDDRNEALIGIQSKAYKYIMNKEEYKKSLEINVNNFIYNIYKDDFNNLNLAIMNELPTEIISILNKVVHKDMKSIRRMKKNASRIRREMLKTYKNNFSRLENNDELKTAINCFYLAIRETFIIFRYTLSKNAFGAIPSNLSIILNNVKYRIGDIYIFNNITQKYNINSKIVTSKSNMKKLQYIIAPYIYSKMHKNNCK